LWPETMGFVPPGWRLCDGKAGTPDMRGRLVIAASGTFNPGAIGGTATHTHTGVITHEHGLEAGKRIAEGAGFSAWTTTDSPAITTEPASNLPPFVALKYIMKLQ